MTLSLHQFWYNRQPLATPRTNVMAVTVAARCLPLATPIVTPDGMCFYVLHIMIVLSVFCVLHALHVLNVDRIGSSWQNRSTEWTGGNC